MHSNVSWKHVFQIAGAFMAWIIGSGFASGQEVLQFFSSYGYASIGVIIINLIGFNLIGYFLMRTGFEHKDQLNFNHFRYFCGSRIGLVYTWFATATLLILMPVLLSGAGATFFEYYGVSKPLGSAVIGLMVLAAYLLGFDRIIKLISPIGPVIIAFSLTVGIVTVIRDFNMLATVPEIGETLTKNQPVAHWAISGLLYLGLNLFPGSTYVTRLGMSPKSMRELRWGVFLGAVVLILSIAIMSTAIMLNGSVTGNLAIPVLYLARRVSYLLGAVFSLTLILGIFTSCTIMLWSIVSRFTQLTKKGNILLSVSIVVIAYVVSLFPFGDLIRVLYPIVGFVGIFFLGIVIYRGLGKTPDKA